MIKRTLLIIGVLFSGLLSYAQQFSDLSQPIPFDKSIRHGVLPNGLTYYIRLNAKPEKRASFYIYQNVGSVLETDEQSGLAHFLEHMAFNGTNTFPGKSMLNMLEHNGIKFGIDINAYTTENETVYNISKVPTERSGLVDTCIIILRDLCNNLALTNEEIDAERGVITEEWRARRNVNARLREKLAPVIYNGSIYVKREPIGSMEVVKNFDPATLRAFYHDWYRTDLQAVAVVGDIDVDKVEKQIISLFSSIPAVENPKERFLAKIPDNKEPLYALSTDKELKNVGISVKIRHEESLENTMDGFRKSYVIGFFNMLMKNRLSEKSQTGDVPYLNASIDYSPFVRGYYSFNINATAKGDSLAPTFEAVYSELQRVIDFGFTNAELERLKTNFLVSIESSYLKSDLIESDSYCKAIKSAYIDKVSLPDAEFKYQFSKEIIPTITVEEVSAIAKKYLTPENRVYTISGPARKNITYPTLSDLEDIIAAVELSAVNAFVDDAPIQTELLSTKPEAGKIVEEKNIESLKATEWTLSNGAKVVFRPSALQKKSIALEGVSYGGASLYSVDDLPSLNAVMSMVPSMGIGAFDPVTFKKVTTGKTAGCTFKIGTYGESVSASAMTNDLETMLQLVYMRFEEPRFDKKNYDKLMARNYEKIAQQTTSNDWYKDTLNAILSNGNPRALKINKSYLDKISFERMEAIYHERFSNAADFTFYIVGDVDAEALKPMVEKYLGAIKSTGTKESWKDNGDYFPKGKHAYKLYVPMSEPKSNVYLKMKAKSSGTRKDVISWSNLNSILNLRFTENIREKEGGTYGVSVRPVSSTLPSKSFTDEITFDCDPSKAEYLKGLVYKELEEVRKHVNQADLDKVVVNLKKNHDQVVENNTYIMSILKNYYENHLDITSPAYFNDIIDKITTKDISKVAKRFFKNADVIEIVVFPKTKN